MRQFAMKLTCTRDCQFPKKRRSKIRIADVNAIRCLIAQIVIFRASLDRLIADIYRKTIILIQDHLYYENIGNKFSYTDANKANFLSVIFN